LHVEDEQEIDVDEIKLRMSKDAKGLALRRSQTLGSVTHWNAVRERPDEPKDLQRIQKKIIV
jgi:hypothetical protein